MRTLLKVAGLVLFLLGASQGLLFAQDYLYAAGNPTFGINFPVNNGFINISNGNLHMEFPLASHQQRGALKLDEKLVYDSRFWMIGHYSNYYWWPNNVPRTDALAAGWRFVTGAETGTLSQWQTSFVTNYCAGPSGAESYNDQYLAYAFSWTDPQGTKHNFDAAYGIHNEPSECGSEDDTPEAVEGFATDASGYKIHVDGVAAYIQNITIVDNNGIQVYPQVIDRYGNYWSQDGSGNLIDDLGRTPVIKTQSGNQIYFDVLTFNGNRARYTVTTEPIQISTGFGEQSVNEWKGTLNAIQSIQLPDGSTYEFTYNQGNSYGSFGDIIDVKLPSGGHIGYGYTNYFDSYRNVNRWISSYTKDGATTSFTPSVISYCSSKGTGCQEQVRLTKPSGDEIVYQLTLNNGAWNTNTVVYQGLASAGNALVTRSNSYDFSHPCNSDLCTGAMYITKSTEVTTLVDNELPTQTQYIYSDPTIGKVTAVKQWDFYSSTVPSSPDIETDYGYNGFDVSSVTVKDGAGNKISEDLYNYTSTATATSNVVNHGSANSGGPYLQSAQIWVNTSNSYLTSSYGMDDTGAVLSITDANGNTTTFEHDTGGQCITKVKRPTVNSVQHQTSATCDASTGLVTSTTDENGLTTTYDNYDQLGRLLSISYPDGGKTTYSYPSATQSVESHLQKPNVWATTTTNYDSYGRRSSVTESDPQGDDVVDYAYDSNGRLYSVSNPHRSSAFNTDGTSYYSYDALDRPTTIKNPDNSTVQMSYSANTVTRTDETGRQRKSTNNAFGWLTKVVEPDSSGQLTVETDYQYNRLGKLTRVDQWGGPSGSSGDRVRIFAYDSLSRLIQETTPESGTVCYGTWSGSNCVGGYDGNGNLLAKTDARGAVTTYLYDALDRMTDQKFQGAPANTPNRKYIYDKYQTSYSGSPSLFNGSNLIGRMTESYTSDNKTHILYAFYSTGQVSAKVSCFSVAGKCGLSQYFDTPIQYAYDYMGNMTLSTNGVANQGIQLTYNYDSVGRLSTLTSSWGGDRLHPETLFQANGTSPAAYDPLGNLNYAQFGINQGSSTPRFYLSQPHTSRGRVGSKTYSTNSMQ